MMRNTERENHHILQRSLGRRSSIVSLGFAQHAVEVSNLTEDFLSIRRYYPRA